MEDISQYFGHSPGASFRGSPFICDSPTATHLKRIPPGGFSAGGPCLSVRVCSARRLPRREIRSFETHVTCSRLRWRLVLSYGRWSVVQRPNAVLRPSLVLLRFAHYGIAMRLAWRPIASKVPSTDYL